MLYKKILYISLFILSAISFFVAVVTDNVVFFVLGTPFFLNLIILLHELGHAFGCLLNGNTITEIKTPIVKITKNTLKIHFEPELKSYCAFIKSDNDMIAFVFGPLFSLISVIVMTLISYGSGSKVLFLFTIVAAVHFVKNLIPVGDTDAKMIILEMRKGKEE